MIFFLNDTKIKKKKTQDMKKTQKLEVLPSVERQSWSDRLDENPFLEWMTSNGKTLLYIVIGLILLTIIVLRFILNSHTASETDFMQADKEYLLFANPVKEGQDPTTQAKALNSLLAIIAQHPELHAKYDGLLAEILLTRGESSQATEYASLAIGRTTDENQPFYTNYAQTTLVIADGKYDQALNEAKALKDLMATQGQKLQNTPDKIQVSTLLYSLNLLRIGMLQQQLGLKEEELATWNEWKNLARQSREGSLPSYLDGQLFMAFDHLLTEGNASFAQYIDIREKALKTF